MRIRGIDLHVQIVGSGKSLIWGHGLMFSMAMEDALGIVDFSRLAAETPARIVRYDARGHGASTGVDRPDDYQWPALAQDMLALADAVGVDRFIAGGQSMGMATSLYAALAAPERIEALVLANPPTAWEARIAQASIYEQMASLVASKGIEALRALFESQPASPRWLWEQSSKSGGPPHVARALDWVDPRTLPSVLRGAGQTDLPPREALPAVTLPTLILAWADDPMHPLAVAETLADLIPAARLEVARDAAGLRAWPEHIRDFVRGLGSRTGEITATDSIRND
jgi:pimeloyl-ACP methyl ester carboxylesterase